MNTNYGKYQMNEKKQLCHGIPVYIMAKLLGYDVHQIG